MTLTDLTTIEHLERCLEGSETCTYELPGTMDERSIWIQTTLVQFRDTSLGISDRGVVIRPLLKVSGLSRHPTPTDPADPEVRDTRSVHSPTAHHAEVLQAVHPGA